jgi:hypothetical protein
MVIALVLGAIGVTLLLAGINGSGDKLIGVFTTPAGKAAQAIAGGAGAAAPGTVDPGNPNSTLPGPGYPGHNFTAGYPQASSL